LLWRKRGDGVGVGEGDEVVLLQIALFHLGKGHFVVVTVKRGVESIISRE